MANAQHQTLQEPVFSGFGGRWPVRRALHRLGLGLFRILVTWQQRSAERQQLASMSDFHLKDIGISRSEALMEADKPFWQA